MCNVCVCVCVCVCVLIRDNPPTKFIFSKIFFNLVAAMFNKRWIHYWNQHLNKHVKPRKAISVLDDIQISLLNDVLVIQILCKWPWALPWLTKPRLLFLLNFSFEHDLVVGCLLKWFVHRIKPYYTFFPINMFSDWV